MTEIKTKENGLEQFLLTAIQAAQICVFEVDPESMRYTRLLNTEAIVARSGDEILNDFRAFEGLAPLEYRARTLDYFYDSEDHGAVSSAFEKIAARRRDSYYARIRTDGREGLWCKVDLLARMEGDRLAAIVGTISNVDRLMRQSESYREKAERDSLTQLLNKRYTESCISRVFESNPSRCHALLLLDLDHFKQVNDSCGHREGDNVLRACAEHMTALFRHTDIIGRWGGDEFVVLMTDVPNEEVLRRKLNQLLECRPGDRGVTRSIGVALFPRDGRGLDELFCKADQALYAAKRTRNAYVIYDGGAVPALKG